MPRTQIEPQFLTERLSILDSDGKLDTRLDPKLPPDDLKRLYSNLGGDLSIEQEPEGVNLFCVIRKPETA
jgi:hypothetical protein